jgi:ribokinase
MQRDAPRLAVVGHVEWVEFIRVDRVPARGEIAHGGDGWETVGGGGGVAAIQLARLAGRVALYTALGRDEVGRRAAAALDRHGVEVHAADRDEPQRRAITFVDAGGERTITTVGPRLSPSGDDPLPWDELAGADGVYFTAGDRGALEAARRARVLVATSRVLDEIGPWGIPLDALVGSAQDERELFDPVELATPPPLAVLTEGAAGGRAWTPAGGWTRYEPTTAPAATRDTYGAGDSFAAGLTYALATGRAHADALRLAARCGAAALARPGPGPAG